MEGRTVRRAVYLCAIVALMGIAASCGIARSTPPVAPPLSVPWRILVLDENGVALALSPTLPLALVAESSPGGIPELLAVSLPSGRVVASDTLPGIPEALDAPPGHTAYVLVSSPSLTSGELLPVSLPSGKLGNALWTGADPVTFIGGDKGTFLILGTYESGEGYLDIVSSRGNVTVGTGGYGPESVALAPGGKTAYVADNQSDTITPVDLATGTAGTAISIPEGRNASSPIVQPGGNPVGIAIAASGTAYVLSDGDQPQGQPGHVTVIDLSTGRVTGNIAVGDSPDSIVLTPSGKELFVLNSVEGANSPPGSVEELPVEKGTIRSHVSVPFDGEALAISANGKQCYLIANDELMALDLG